MVLNRAVHMQAVYGLRVGDSLIFGRMPNGELVIGGRERQGPLPPPRASFLQENPVMNLERSKRRKRGQLKPYDPSEYDLSFPAQACALSPKATLSKLLLGNVELPYELHYQPSSSLSSRLKAALKIPTCSHMCH